MAAVVHDLDPRHVNSLRLVAGDHGDVVDGLPLELVHQPPQQRPSRHRQHGLGTVLGQRVQSLTATGSQHQRRQVALGGGVLALRRQQFLRRLQPENLVDRRDPVLHVHQRLGGVDLAGELLHGRHSRAQGVVGPDDEADAGDAEHVGGGAVVLGGNDDQWRAPGPLPGEGQNFVGAAFLAVDQNSVGAGLAVRLGAAQGLVHAPTRDQRLHPSDDDEIRILLAVLSGADLALKLGDVGQRLAMAVDEAVGFGEQLVLDAHAGDAPLLQLLHQAAHVVEVAVASVAVDEDGNAARIGHELQHVHHLGPARLVVVAHPELRGEGEPAGPDALEAGLLDDAGADAVMRLHEELQLGGVEKRAQGGGFGGVGWGSVHKWFLEEERGVYCCNRGSISRRARSTSPGKSISIHGRPVTSSTPNRRGPASSIRSRRASSWGS